ncbi:hypothetical protein DL768_001090 [Monosporascus sp. mg162]|nr:hypothetical protein DL768_001090 [Monosporascus sp. mg162]
MPSATGTEIGEQPLSAAESVRRKDIDELVAALGAELEADAEILSRQQGNTYKEAPRPITRYHIFKNGLDKDARYLLGMGAEALILIDSYERQRRRPIVPQRCSGLTYGDVQIWRKCAVNLIRSGLPQSLYEDIRWEIFRYDMRVQPFKARKWEEVKRNDNAAAPPTFTQIEVIRCTEMGYAPEEIRQLLVKYEVEWYLDITIPFTDMLEPIDYNGIKHYNPKVKVPRKQTRIQDDVQYAENHGGFLPEKITT